jgi:hypothetical protein
MKLSRYKNRKEKGMGEMCSARDGREGKQTVLSLLATGGKGFSTETYNHCFISVSATSSRGFRILPH